MVFQAISLAEVIEVTLRAFDQVFDFWFLALVKRAIRFIQLA